MAAAAEGSSSPYWDHPSKEPANILAVKDKVEAAGGEAMVMWMAKSHNRNCLMYVFNPTSGKVEARWLTLEDSHRKKHLTKEEYEAGAPCIRPITEGEAPFMGVETKCQPDGSIQVIFNVLEDTSDAVRFRCNLVADSDGALGLVATTKDGKPCRLDYGYIQCKKGLLMDVEYLSIYARTFDGESICEKVLP